MWQGRSDPATARAFSQWRSGLRLAITTSCIILLRLASGTGRHWRQSVPFAEAYCDATLLGYSSFGQLPKFEAGHINGTCRIVYRQQLKTCWPVRGEL